MPTIGLRDPVINKFCEKDRFRAAPGAHKGHTVTLLLALEMHHAKVCLRLPPNILC